MPSPLHIFYRNCFARNISIHGLLIERISEFHHDIVNAIGELRVSNQRLQPFVFLFIPMDLTEYNDIVRLECLQDNFQSIFRARVRLSRT